MIATPISILLFACALITASALVGYLVVVLTDKRTSAHVGGSAPISDSYSGIVTMENVDVRPTARTEAPLPRPGAASPT